MTSAGGSFLFPRFMHMIDIRIIIKIRQHTETTVVMIKTTCELSEINDRNAIIILVTLEILYFF